MKALLCILVIAVAAGSVWAGEERTITTTTTVETIPMRTVEALRTEEVLPLRSVLIPRRLALIQDRYISRAALLDDWYLRRSALVERRLAIRSFRRPRFSRILINW